MPIREYELGSAELEVLVALWDDGPGTVRHVLNHLRQRGRKLAYTTVQTFLTRLEQKGFAKSNKSDLAFVYRAAVTRDRVTRSRLRGVIQQLFDGAAGPLVLQLLRTERLSRDELDELQTLIDRLDSDNRRPKKKK